MENIENDRKDDMIELLQKLSGTETGVKVERALFRLKKAMDKAAFSGEDLSEMGRRCYADLAQAKEELGDAGDKLAPFFAMFEGVFTDLDIEELDPHYQYDPTDEDLDPEFLIVSSIPLEGDVNPLAELKSAMQENYPQYTVISGEELGIDNEEEEDESHFFIQSEHGTLCAISYVDDESKLEALTPLIDNTDSDYPDEFEEALRRLDENRGKFLEIYLSPEAGVVPENEFDRDGLQNQEEKAEMAINLANEALRLEAAIALFTNGRVFVKEEYDEMVNASIETSEAIDLYAYTYKELIDDKTTAFMTMGLVNYGYLELFTTTSEDELESEEMLIAFQHLVPYILRRGMAIRSGEVLALPGDKGCYRLDLSDDEGEAVYKVTRLRPDSEMATYTIHSEYQGPLSWNRYKGMVTPLSYYINDRKVILLLHIPGTEVGYERFLNDYAFLLDNLTYAFEGIRNFFEGEDALKQDAIRSYMKINEHTDKATWKDVLLSLVPTDLFLEPVVETMRDSSSMLRIRYRKRRNSRSFLELCLNGNGELSEIGSR